MYFLKRSSPIELKVGMAWPISTPRWVIWVGEQVVETTVVVVTMVGGEC